MQKGLKSLRVGLIVIMASLIFVIGGCTKYASEEDLAELERQKQAALAAEKKVEDLKREKADLERQLAAKERELREAQNILSQVKR